MDANKGLIFPEKVIACEVGPRDGLQNEKKNLTIDQKIELIHRSVEAGAKIIEIGSFVHPKAVPQMSDTDEVAKRIKRVDGVEYRALAMNLKGLERAKEAGINKVKLTVSASKSHSLSNLNKTPQDAVKGFHECATYAANNGITLSGAISTAFGCSMEGFVHFEEVISVVKAFIEIGVTELSLSDTTGMANPKQVYENSIIAKALFPNITWNLHFHNTRGMGLANVMAGMMAGVNRFDSCFAGLGGCPFAPGASGNIATEDLINMCNEMNVKTDYDIDKMILLGKYVQQLFERNDTGSFILKAGKNSDIVSK